MGLPPVLGAVQERFTDRLPATARRPVGAPGKSGVVTGAVADEAGPLPTALKADTAKVYVAPFARPVTDAVVPVTVTTAEAVAGERLTV
jgi:hypothetical protein